MSDDGDRSDGITVTLMILVEVPPPSDKVTVTTPIVSVPEKVDLENCTVSTIEIEKNGNTKHSAT